MNKIVILYGLLLIVLLLPLINFDIESFWGNYFSFILSVLIYLIFINLEVNNIEHKILLFIRLSILVLCGKLLYTVFMVVSNGTEAIMYKAQIQIALGNSNGLGFFLLIFFFILYNSGKRNGFIDNSLLILLILSIVSLQSRSTMLAFIIVLAIHLFEKDFKRILMVGISFCLAVVFFQSIYTDSQGQMITGYYSDVPKIESPSKLSEGSMSEDETETLTPTLGDNSLYQKLDDISSKRLTLYSEVIDEFKKSPIIGVGIGNIFIDFMGSYMPVRAHNIFLEILTTSGILGFFIFFSILFLVLKFLFENKKDNFYICGVFYGLIAILVQGMLEPNIFDYKVDIFLWTFIGASFLISENSILNNSEKIKGNSSFIKDINIKRKLQEK